MYYNKQGEKIEMKEWTELFELNAYKIIKQHTIGKYFISTIWLGLDHGFGEGKPIIFETMVFLNKDCEDDLEQNRYATLEEAKIGHQEILDKYKNKGFNLSNFFKSLFM